MNIPAPNTNESCTTIVPAPHICPGCGRCRDCGRPYETQPINPYNPPWPTLPYVGDVPGWMQWGPTCGTAVGVSTIGSAYGGSTQIWN